MGVLDNIRRALGGELAVKEAALAETASELGRAEASVSLLHERLAELELSLEDRGWDRLSGESDREFSRAGLRRINRLARLYWLKNPLILRGVAIKASFVFAQGVSITARDEAANEVLQAFLDDPDNQVELTSHEARMTKERELQVHANLYFTLFSGVTGRVRVRSFPEDEVEDIISDPEDAKRPWYYKRTRTPRVLDANGEAVPGTTETAFHPDWRYKPAARPATIGGHRVAWDAPVYHVAVNRLSDMKFGVSEVYAAIDWAKAYKDFLEDWATIVRAYARFAWQAKVKGGTTAVAAVKDRFGTALSASSGAETNPPPATGSMFVANQGVDLQPMKTAGATTSAEDGRHLKLMALAALGIPEHYVSEADNGNRATAEAMELPVKLMVVDRQALWADVLKGICLYVLEVAARAPGGRLPMPTVTRDGDREVVEWPQGFDRRVEVTFPPLIELDVQKAIAAIISAGTLDGKAPAGLDLPTITKLCLQALGVPDIDELMTELFPPGWEEDRAAKAAAAAQAAQAAMGDQQPDPVAEAARELREAIAAVMLPRAA
jgi:hypothetical protein